MTGDSLTLDRIRQNLKEYVGRRVLVRANKGRKRIVERRGTLEDMYPDLFLIRLGAEQHNRSVSYTYADILTKDVEISVLDEKDRPRVLFNVS